MKHLKSCSMNTNRAQQRMKISSDVSEMLTHTTEKCKAPHQRLRLHPAGTSNGKYFTVIWRYLQPSVNTVISTRISGVATIRQECAKVRGPQREKAHEPHAINYFHTNLTSSHTSGKIERIRENSDSLKYLQGYQRQREIRLECRPILKGLPTAARTQTRM